MSMLIILTFIIIGFFFGWLFFLFTMLYCSKAKFDRFIDDLKKARSRD